MIMESTKRKRVECIKIIEHYHKAVTVGKDEDIDYNKINKIRSI